MKTNNYNDYRIKSLENDSKTSKALAAISGATATIATAVTIGNLTIGNDLIALQNLGTTVAMAGYVIGYLNKARLNNKEVTRLEETKDKPDRPEDRITELKNTITQTKNSLAMSTTAAVGFGISTLKPNAIAASEGYNWHIFKVLYNVYATSARVAAFCGYAIRIGLSISVASTSSIT